MIYYMTFITNNIFLEIILKYLTLNFLIFSYEKIIGQFYLKMVKINSEVSQKLCITD